MNKETIENMKAGREMDALIAELVMGLEVVHYEWPCDYDPECGIFEAQSFIDDHSYWKDELSPVHLPTYGDWPPYWDDDYGCWICFIEPIPFYSTNIEDAWKVVEKFDTFYISRYVDLAELGKIYYVAKCAYQGMFYLSDRHDTAEEAICQAALLSRGL